MMRTERGFSLLEMLTSLALSGVILTSAGFILQQLFSESKNLETWSASQFEMSLSLRELEAELRNVVRLEPMETGAGRDYMGVLSLRPGEQPSFCLNDEGASVIRYTTLERRKKAAMLLRGWAENLSVGESGAAHELRVTASTEWHSLFQDAGAPSEVVVVDADRRYIRRYEVAGYNMHLNYSLDPYDDQPKTDNFGAAKIFNFASVHLRMSRNQGGAQALVRPLTVITGSEVYGANTYVVCLRASDRSLIKWNTVTEEEKVLLANPTNDFEIRSFRVQYLGTQRSRRVETANFTDEMTDAAGECVNTVAFEIHLQANESLQRRNQNLMIQDIKDKIVRRRVIFSPNLNSRRPVRCET